MSISERADPQLKPLYRWESANGWDVSTISFKKSKSFIISACELYNVEPPKVQLHTTRLLPWSCPSENIISMQQAKYLNIPITLHETAHHIVYKLYGARPQDHGPTFLKIYLELLTQFYSTKFTGIHLAWYSIAYASGLRW